MATNAAGFPYPLGSDRVADGDDSIKALADKVPWFQAGTVSLPGDATNPRSAAVVFPVAFPRAPIVMVQCMTGISNSSTTHQGANPSSITATGFNVTGNRNNTTTMSVQWVAFLARGVAGP